MQVILPLLPDPADIVVQGEQTVIYAPSASMLSPVLQGQVIGDKTLGDAVPCAMIGQHDWYGIKPRRIGPMRQAGGGMEMVDIGASLTPNPDAIFVDPTQKWQATAFEIDKCGFPLLLNESKVIGAPEAFAQFMVSEPETVGNPVVNIPRGAVYRSGLAKRTTMPTLPDSFGRHTALDSFVESTNRWFVNGITKDGAGAPLGDCRVLVMRADKVVLNPDILANPVEADVTSDGTGNYSVQVPNDLPRQMMSYKAGGTDVAGVTVNTVIPTKA